MRLLGLLVTLTLLLAAAGGESASADVTCTYDSATRTVTLQLAGTITFLERSGTAIEATGQPCGGATVLNTDTIVVNGTDQPDELLLNEPKARFTGVRFEIHMSEFDYVSIYRGDGNDTITVGQDGIALYADGGVDMQFLDGWPRLQFDTYGGNDHISGQGGHGTGAPTYRPLDIREVGGGDVIHGGEGPDMLIRNWHNLGSAPDHIYGGGGSDYTSLIWTDSGTVISGGDGVDTVYAAWQTPVTLSLDGVANDGMPGAATNNVLPDVENLGGGVAADTLIGDNAANRLTGGGGDDVLAGGWGPDQLIGGGGNDQLDAGNGMADRVQGGKGTDSARVDCGLDTVDVLESTTCAPPPPEAPASIFVGVLGQPQGHLSPSDPATVPLVFLTRCATPGCDASLCDARWELRVDGGPWQLLPATSPAPILTRSFAIGTGQTYQVRARTVGCNGILSAPRTGRIFVVEGFDESAASYTAEWATELSPGAWGGSLARTGPTGTADFAFTGFRVAWIGLRDGSLGPGLASLDGSTCPSASEHASIARPRQVIAECGDLQGVVGAHNLPHSLSISSKPSQQGAAITVDGFVVLAYAAAPTGA